MKRLIGIITSSLVAMGIGLSPSSYAYDQATLYRMGTTLPPTTHMATGAQLAYANNDDYYLAYNNRGRYQYRYRTVTRYDRRTGQYYRYRIKYRYRTSNQYGYRYYKGRRYRYVKKQERRVARRGQFASSRPATGRRVFIFSPRKRMWAAYGPDGKLVRTGAASGGKGYCPDIRRRCRTPVGVYRVNSKGGPGCKSSKFPVGRGGAPMPYCMFFRGGYAVHGSNHVPAYNASHGCIRVRPSDAQWLSHSFMKIGTKVIVTGY